MGQDACCVELNSQEIILLMLPLLPGVRGVGRGVGCSGPERWDVNHRTCLRQRKSSGRKKECRGRYGVVREVAVESGSHDAAMNCLWDEKLGRRARRVGVAGGS